MLKRLYIDNCKCMVNFEFRPAPLQPMFGLNGTGKTTVFEALQAVRNFVVNGFESTVAFPFSTLTRWDDRDTQTFEVDVASDSGEYSYHLEICHNQIDFSSVVRREVLTFDGKVVFTSENGQAILVSESGQPGLPISINSTRSGLSFLSATGAPIGRFKNWLARLFFLKLVPSLINSRSEEDQFYLDPSGSNFASWFRHFSLESPSRALQLMTDLREVIDGFSELSASAYDVSSKGNVVRSLNAKMYAFAEVGTDSTDMSFQLHELSDGQRVLIVLYSALRALRDTNAILCLDEPANYVALSEIQPYLSELTDAVGTGPSQALVISHHPEVIDYLAVEDAVLFERDGSGPVRIRPFEVDRSKGLKASEVVARGWENE